MTKLMNRLTGRNFAAVLIAGLLVLASTENQADELDRYLEDAIRAQVMQELKDNVQRLYESAELVPATSAVGNGIRIESLGFSVADRRNGAVQRFGALN